MPKPNLNFVWIGEPRFDQGGQDVIGPETIAQNLKDHSNAHSLAELKETSNPLIFWCLESHQERYKKYFATKEIAIEVKPIEPFLREFKVENDAIPATILKIFSEHTSPGHNTVVDRVCLKDLFFNFILAYQGHYVLDTNVHTFMLSDQDEPSVDMPAHAKFMFPWVRNTAEVWMQYSPPNNLQRAKNILDLYLKLYMENIRELYNKPDNAEEYHKAVCSAAATAVRLNQPKKLENFDTDDCGVWDCGKLSSTEVDVLGLNVQKEYYNSHRKSSEQAYRATHEHVYYGHYKKLSFYLSHGGNPDSEANPRKEKTGLDYDANKETLLHLSLRGCKSKKYRKCAELLLAYGADPNREHEFIQNTITYIKTPLIYALESGSKETVKILFNTKIPINVNKILNQDTPLMLAIRGNTDCIDLLLKKGADPNIFFESTNKRNTPLAMAVRRGNSKAVKSLLENDKAANPNIPIKQKQIGFQILAEYPLHTALKQNDAVTARLLLEHGADLSVVSEYKQEGKIIRSTTEQISTSKECKDLLLEFSKNKSPSIKIPADHKGPG